MAYYADTAPIPAARAGVEGLVHCDVCVIGAGIAGCSAALHLAERGYRVLLLEEHRVGWGASGRSGAQALYGIACAQDELQQLVGPEDARRVFDVSVAGLALMRERIARHQIQCDWVDGQMDVANRPQHLESLRQLQQLLRSYGYTSPRLIERAQLATTLASTRYCGALYDPNCGHLHPLRYTLGLAQAAELAGVTLFEGTRALSYQPLGSGLLVQTAHGAVHCSQLVLAGNAYLGETAPPLMRKIATFMSYVIATEPLGAERAHALIGNNAAVTDMNWALNYYRLSADHRLLFGAGISFSDEDAWKVGRYAQHRMLQVFPQLREVKIDYAWGGEIDITANRAPHFGRLADNVWFLQGFSGHGIALTGIAGQLVAEAIAGTVERFDVFARIPHQNFPRGANTRRALLRLAMLWYRLRDLF